MHHLMAGRLNQRITLQQRAQVQNGLGEDEGPWVDFATVWAQAEPLRGREFFAAAQLQDTTDVRFRMRWRSGVTPLMRVVWRSKPYDIQAVIETDGAMRALELMTVQRGSLNVPGPSLAQTYASSDDYFAQNDYAR